MMIPPAPVLTPERPMWPAYAIAAGAGLAVVGSLLPWVEITAPLFGSFSLKGTDGDGVFTMALGAAGLIGLARQNACKVIGVLISLVLVALTVYEISNVRSAVGEASAVSDGMVHAQVGVGLWVVLAGAVALLVGTLNQRLDEVNP